MNQHERKRILKKRTDALETRARTLNRMILFCESETEKKSAQDELALIVATLNVRGFKTKRGLR